MLLKEHAAFDPLLRAKDAADYLGVSVKTLRAMANQRQIASVRPAKSSGCPMRFKLSALNAWARRCETPALKAAL